MIDTRQVAEAAVVRHVDDPPSGRREPRCRLAKRCRRTFSNRVTARELIVDIDDDARRLAYSVVEGRPTHHHASFEVFPDGDGRSRIVWIADFLPDEHAPAIAGMIEQGLQAMRRTLASA